MLRDHHGLHALDFLQVILGVLQLQLQLFHFQPFPFQGKVGQSGVKGHQQIALLHRVTHCHMDFRNGLGIGQVNGLNLVGGDGAIAFLGIAPVFGHADVHKGIDIHRLRTAVAKIVPATKTDGCNQNQRNHRDDDLLGILTFHGRPLPSGL